MDTLKDIWATMVAGVRDRTTNPLTLSFIVSWSLWNYKFFVILFEDTGSKERLNAIAAMYPHESTTYLGEALMYPLASALVYVFVYPVFSMIPIGVYRKYQVWTANLIKKVEKSRVLTQEEATALTRRHEKEKAALEAEIASHTEELTQLRNALKDAEEQIGIVRATVPTEAPVNDSDEVDNPKIPAKAPNPNVVSPNSDKKSLDDEGLSDLKTRVILLLSNRSGATDTEGIAKHFGINLSLMEVELSELEERSLIRYTQQYGVDRWSITKEGKDLAVKFLREKNTS